MEGLLSQLNWNRPLECSAATAVGIASVQLNGRGPGTAVNPGLPMAADFPFRDLFQSGDWAAGGGFAIPAGKSTLCGTLDGKKFSSPRKQQESPRRAD